ncbi:helix-turn-helix transcriptional regulator [Anaerocellum diazotrophicum]|uniref:HTH luxR-type domain-containing protein n=1 Tax=Caldicellulosiruptor diazotrophicus TaxID=2806205 RepID=A0ABN6E5A9_9FIRM|nr:LuxR C-terminal-related transcriptional regulator [Caldicellulosiruptor diazotrophicus]BCS80555.1 hypothetical protein CaldiYA01_05150 [Caldicellulosiruptor diazotrophicus]
MVHLCDGNYNFTQRELQILLLLSQGMTNKDIANQLKIKIGTVRNHLKTIYKKLDIDNRNMLIKWTCDHQNWILAMLEKRK